MCVGIYYFKEGGGRETMMRQSLIGCLLAFPQWGCTWVCALTGNQPGTPGSKVDAHPLNHTDWATLSFLFAVFIPNRSSSLYPTVSADEISEAKTKLRCGGYGVKKQGLLNSESWWVQGQHRSCGHSVT